MIKQTTINSFENDLKLSQVVVVDFGAPWCAFCKKIEPELERVDDEVDGLTILKVNTDIEYELAEKFGVDALPTLILFNGGVEAKRQLGFMSSIQIKEFISK